jgi:hypothetical protein
VNNRTLQRFDLQHPSRSLPSLAFPSLADQPSPWSNPTRHSTMDHEGEVHPENQSLLFKWRLPVVVLSLLAIPLCLWLANEPDRSGIKWLETGPPAPPSFFVKYRTKVTDFMESIRVKMFGPKPMTWVQLDFQFTYEGKSFAKRGGFPIASTNSEGSMAWVLDPRQMQILKSIQPEYAQEEGNRGRSGSRVVSLQKPAANGSTVNLFGGSTITTANALPRLHVVAWGTKIVNDDTFTGIKTQFEMTPVATGEDIVLKLKVWSPESVIGDIRQPSVIRTLSPGGAKLLGALEATIPKGGGALAWIKGDHGDSTGFLIIIKSAYQTNQAPLSTGIRKKKM